MWKTTRALGQQTSSVSSLAVLRRRYWQPSQDYLSGIFRDLRPKFRVVIQIANNLTIRGLDAHSLDHVARKSSGIELSIRVERRCE